MTDQEINKAIAEALGWSHVRQVNHRIFDQPKSGMVGTNGVNKTGWPVPDYVNYLDAMHEAEQTLKTHDQAHEFRMLLHGDVSATARQRAEAFLRTLGKWREA